MVLPAFAADVQPAILYDLGGKFDKSFNEAAYHGAEKFKAETGIAVYKWDVSSYDACEAGLKQVEADLGPVEVLVNNAGITRDTMFHRMTPEQWTAVITTNRGSLFNMCRHVIEGMRSRKFGRIVNISSINGQKGEFGQANYSAAKVGVIGFSQRSPVETVAKQFPAVKFTIVDAVVDLPNVQSVVYREHEGSFLVGMLAAMKSKTGKVGFVGGMDIPLIRKFELGYEEGARFANPKIEVLQNMTGTTPAAWADPTRGAELARSQFDRGVDVVFAAAGTTGLGVLQAAKDAGKFSIGVDSNQNYLHPGSVLTSMVKRVDNAVYTAFKTAQAGVWKPGLQVIGLAEDGIGYAVDANNAALLTPEMTAKLEAAKADIIAGKIKVTDYMAK